MNPIDRPTRRTVVKAGAWSAPAIVVAAAVPSYAASGAPTLTVLDGATAATTYDAGGVIYDAIQFDNFTIEPSAASTLSMTIVARTSSGDPASVYRDDESITDISPWVSNDEEFVTLSSLTYTYPTEVAAGTPTPVNGLAAVALDAGYQPVPNAIFTVTIDAPGATPVTRTFQRAIARSSRRAAHSGPGLRPGG